jgi:hypothetical protein
LVLSCRTTNRRASNSFSSTLRQAPDMAACTPGIPPASIGNVPRGGMTGRVLAVVAGTAKDSPALPVCEFVNISLCDVVKREA